MKHIYTVYDTVAQTVLPTLIVEASDAPAIRAFHDALSAPNSLLAQHPADFNLLLLGSIQEDGTLLPAPSPTVLATGSAWLEHRKETNNG